MIIWLLWSFYVFYDSVHSVFRSWPINLFSRNSDIFVQNFKRFWQNVFPVTTYIVVHVAGTHLPIHYSMLLVMKDALTQIIVAEDVYLLHKSVCRFSWNFEAFTSKFQEKLKASFLWHFVFNKPYILSA